MGGMATRGGKYWEYSFELHHEEGHECARDPREWCAGYRLVDQSGGTALRLPGLTYRTFCGPCETQIGVCLEELPSAYRRLGDEIGERGRGGQNVRSPFGPNEPLNKGIDALLRYMAPTVHGWAARVRPVMKLHAPDPRRRIYPPEMVEDACGVLEKNLGPFLSLQPAWMIRAFPLPAGKPGGARDARSRGVCRHCGRPVSRSTVTGKWWAADEAGGARGCTSDTHRPIGDPAGMPPPAIVSSDLMDLIGDCEIVRIGIDYVTVMSQSGAATGGNDIIDLHYRARKILGETKTPAETFDGIPCRSCEDMALERAEPPSDPKTPAMMSRCHSCGDTMNPDEFREWGKRYARWAEHAGLPACRRCSRGLHDQCVWPACPCRASGHAAAVA